ncbi:MAG TPA: hypothetical protein VMT50_08380, partial [Steroidobacteraceae bacterium]|nr:hypothetical protein [Steroidobacteraceae bacterium]
MRTRFAFCLLATALAVPVRAAPAEPPAFAQPLGPHPSVVTHLKGRFNGQPVAYTATVEALEVKDPNGETRIVSFAYTRDGVRDPAHRPVVFLFNGGP